jgi:hypothetical protein
MPAKAGIQTGPGRVSRLPSASTCLDPGLRRCGADKADELNKKIMAAITMERCFGAMAAVTNGEHQENSRHRLT